MKLGYLLDRFPVPSETFIERELEGLARLGVRPVIWALRPSDAAPATEAAARIAREVRVLPSPCSARAAAATARVALRSPAVHLETALRFARGAGRSARSFAGEMHRARQAHCLAEDIRREGVTHLHAQFGSVPSSVAWLAWLARRVPYSVSVHAWDIFVNRAAMPEKLLAARRVITCTAYARRFLLKRYPRLDPGKVICCHHGLDVDRYAPAPAPEGGVFRVLAAGRLVPKKGFDVLLRAMPLVRAALGRNGPGASLVIAGEGPERARIERLAAELGLGESLRMTGAVGPDAVRDEMARANAVAVSSVRDARGDMDGLPNVVLEAMASARPVVASRLSGIPEAVADGVTGFLTRPGGAGEMAEALVRLARDRSLARTLGANGRAVVEKRFSLEASAAGLAKVFGELAAPTVSPPRGSPAASARSA